MKQKNDKLALFILRIGLGVFLLLWAIDKLVAPDSTVKIFQMFYNIPITLNVAFIVGIAEAILAIAIMTGMWKQWSYGLGLAAHTISVLSSYKQHLDPFGKNHLFIAGLPVLAAFIALYMLRDKDTLWSLGEK
ncbi:MAG: DoxX family membrane protein [Candidatus Nanoarchaeia archaeon]